eukprot:SAG31_NODE_18_length_35375_cov_22.525315_9_plen_74_part_00
MFSEAFGKFHVTSVGNIDREATGVHEPGDELLLINRTRCTHFILAAPSSHVKLLHAMIMTKRAHYSEFIHAPE